MNHPKKQENIDISTNHTTDQRTCLSVSTMTVHLLPHPPSKYAKKESIQVKACTKKEIGLVI